ncbi:MAG: glucokinase [Chromatiales bacterium]|jgi:glucokinase|nr:glucokinase [Chromatiales bacterium]MDX9768401.1 glucokinase [Ectothiorhodospiraceae bacterium]
MTVLAGDVGGTKTLLTLAERGPDGRPRVLAEQRYVSGEHADFTALVRDFLTHNEADAIDAACFAVAGPVERGRDGVGARLTNLPWRLSEGALARDLGIAGVALINDFEGIAHSLGALGPDDLVTLQAGTPEPGGVRLVAGAGTGLGICAICPGSDVRTLPTEGGHAGFAPADAREARLWAFIAAREGRCTREHLLTGRGIARILNFIAADEGLLPGEALVAAMQQEDPAAAISRFGLAGDDDAAQATLDLFCRIYAGQLGDLALSFLPRGGLYVAGGIAPRLIERIRRPAFLDAFNAKPPMQAVVRAIPLHVITETRAGLIGAAMQALGRHD